VSSAAVTNNSAPSITQQNRPQGTVLYNALHYF